MHRILRNWVEASASERDLVLPGGVLRFALNNTTKIFLAAEIADLVVHLILDRLSLLPYPLSTALIIGSSVTAIVSGIVGFYFLFTVGRAIRDLAANRNAFQRLSETDHLTGLLNRRAFFGGIGQDAPAGAFLLFDIDHFKTVNDRFGHGAGDDVICAVGALLADLFRAASGRVGRIGGEEFAVFVEPVTPEKGLALADQARLAVSSSPIATRAGPIAVTISGGHAYRGSSSPIEDLFGLCDDSLYRAKSMGRNRIVDSRDMRLGGHAQVPAKADANPEVSDAGSRPSGGLLERTVPPSKPPAMMKVA